MHIEWIVSLHISKATTNALFNSSKHKYLSEFFCRDAVISSHNLQNTIQENNCLFWESH